MTADRTCSLYHCTRPVKAESLCVVHLRKLREKGDPYWTALRTPMERFWAKFAVDPETGCWVWHGSKDGHGYGVFSVGSGPGSRWPAHRWSLSMLGEGGPIPHHLTDVDHLCRNPPCVNPSHLEAVTHAENLARGSSATATHCKNGHEWDEANTYIRPDSGTRQCRVCANERKAAPSARERKNARRRTDEYRAARRATRPTRAEERARREKP